MDSGREELSMVCFCFILIKIQEKARGFNYEPDSEAVKRYINNASYLLKRFSPQDLLSFASLAHKYAFDTFGGDKQNVREYFRVNRFPGTLLTANEAEIAIAWAKHYISTHVNLRLEFASIIGKGREIARGLGFSESFVMRSFEKLLRELIDDIFYLYSIS